MICPTCGEPLYIYPKAPYQIVESDFQYIKCLNLACRFEWWHYVP